MGYLSNPPMLVLPKPERPLILYLTVLDNSFGSVLGHHDIIGRKEQAIYYLSKKFTSYEKPMPTGRLAKWQIFLTEFDIIYVTRTAKKAQALVDHLAENPVDEEYEPLRNYFPDEEVINIDEVEQDENPGWKHFFDGVANMKGVGIWAVLISEIKQHYPITAQLCFYCTNNMAESVEFSHIPRIHYKVSDGLATLASMLHHPDKAYVYPLHIQVHDQYAYCNVVEEELHGEPWFHDIPEYIKIGVYPVEAMTFKSVTKKAVVDFVHSNIICRFEIPKVIITDNGANLYSHLMKEVCQQFRITHCNSTLYIPKVNGAVEVDNNSIKKIL
ncbi:uncharacterized protein [Nicotiana sylvestris]|uniref:uncharacterized protein n=1 Tax=Nicotiana sylvestris TaxID=4096 RepID=UPI00388C6520